MSDLRHQEQGEQDLEEQRKQPLELAPRAAARVVDLLDYRVHVAPFLLDEAGRMVHAAAPAHTYVVVTDDQVAEYHAAHVVGSLRHFAKNTRVLYRAIPAGEGSKTREHWGAITDWMLGERCGRDTTVIALGGGVVGDLAGFVAATFMRGVRYVQIPTSLLAMVDASVGGKVGVDTPAGKNLVGAFHQPAAVLIDPTVLQTLPLAHLRAGMAEVVKHGVIADAAYLRTAESLGTALLAAREHPAAGGLAWHGNDLASLIEGSVRIKASVVAADEREAGVRQILNFGHTVGHAVELASDWRLLHGEAVAIGMVVEAALAERCGVAAEGVAFDIARALSALGLPTALPSHMAPDGLLEAMRLDKKGRGGKVVFALPQAIGRMAGADSGYGISVPDPLILEVLRASVGQRSAS